MKIALTSCHRCILCYNYFILNKYRRFSHGTVEEVFKIPVLGMIIGLVGGLVDLYVLVGVVLSVLDYMKVLK